MLHPHPQLIHLGKVELDVIDGVLDDSVLVRARLLQRVGQDILGALKQVVPEVNNTYLCEKLTLVIILAICYQDLNIELPEEQSPQRVLHPTAHLNEVSQDVSAGVFLSLDVDDPHRD